MQRRMKEVSQGNRPKRKPLRRERKVLLAVAMVFVVYIFAFCYVPIAGWGLSVFRYKPAFGLNFAKQKFSVPRANTCTVLSAARRRLVLYRKQILSAVRKEIPCNGRNAHALSLRCTILRDSFLPKRAFEYTHSPYSSFVRGKRIRCIIVHISIRS